MTSSAADVLAESGRGLLADFGIALCEELSTITRVGSPVATPGWMAPETLMGGRATAAGDF